MVADALANFSRKSASDGAELWRGVPVRRGGVAATDAGS